MGNFDNPSAAFEQRIIPHLLDLLSSLFYVRYVTSVFDSFLCRLARVALVSTKMLNGVWTRNDDLVKH
jgi:hypothetical protein